MRVTSRRHFFTHHLNMHGEHPVSLTLRLHSGPMIERGCRWFGWWASRYRLRHSQITSAITDCAEPRSRESHPVRGAIPFNEDDRRAVASAIVVLKIQPVTPATPSLEAREASAPGSILGHPRTASALPA